MTVGTTELARSTAESAQAALEVASSIGEVREQTLGSSGDAHRVKTSSSDLGELADKLNQQLSHFKF